MYLLCKSLSIYRHSHLFNSDGRGQLGIIATLGSAPIFLRSSKLKCLTRSSAESELYAAEEAATFAIWFKHILIELELWDSNKPITLAMDNKSAIIMAAKGVTFKNNKHLMNKYFLIMQGLKEKDIYLIYIPTKIMVADLLTKSLPLPRILALQQLLSQVCL